MNETVWLWITLMFILHCIFKETDVHVHQVFKSIVAS